MSKTGTTASYKYNDSGIRTQKIVGGVTTNYYLDGDKVVYETNDTDTIYYTYDENGDLIGFQLNNTDYYYVRNGQNDIIGILDSNGDQVVSYLYDSWGKLISTTGSAASTVGAANPYRYRGYRFDAETGFYSLLSRYYDPQTGRFLNADSIVADIGEIKGYNLYEYCDNNPVNKIDPDGHKPGDLFDSMDDAAHDFSMIYAQKSYDNRVEYASFIYSNKVKVTTYVYVNGKKKKKTTKVTKYSYVKPNKGNESGASVPINWFGLKKKVAEIHTHTWIPGHYNDKFSPGDLDKWINYVSTPSGTVRKYDPKNPSIASDKSIKIFSDTPKDPKWGTK